MIPEVKLSNGIMMPVIGYGSYLATEGKGKQSIIDAVNAGYTSIDTASFYKNEHEIGQALESLDIDRKDLFITSKVWPTELGYENSIKSFKESISKLKTDYLDLLLIHWPKKSQNDEKWKEKIIDTWRAFEELYDEGKVRAIGLSNFLPHHIKPILEVCRHKPMVDQLELHVGYMQEYALGFLKQNDIVPVAWSPLGRGKVIEDDMIVGFAEKYNKTPAQILLKYLLQRGIVVIPKSSSIERMKENKDLFDFEITEEDISYMSCIPQLGFSTEYPDWVEL